MTNDNKSIEVGGPSVDAAIESALDQLGIGRDQATVEIVQEERSGFLGIGNRDAVVRVTTKSADEDDDEGAITAEAVTDEVDDTELSAVEPSPSSDDEFDEFDDLDDLPDPELLEEQEISADVVRTLLDKMGVDAELNAVLSEKDELGKQVVELHLTGDDLDDLIGRQGDTLSSMQYLARLMASQRLRRRVGFVIDVNHHRQRKEEGLSKLAQRMAGKVLRRNRPVTLEPMNPYERRLIHMSLRDSEDVYTRSVGEGRDRRVRIYPKNE